MNKTDEIMTKVHSLVACLNAAYTAHGKGWRQGCFDSADLCLVEIRRLVDDLDCQGEYRRGLMEAFNLANMINANRQGRTAEETCSYLVRSLGEIANTEGQ